MVDNLAWLLIELERAGDDVEAVDEARLTRTGLQPTTIAACARAGCACAEKQLQARVLENALGELVQGAGGGADLGDALWNVAALHAALGQRQAAIAMLRRAKSAGTGRFEGAAEHPEFALLCDDPDFRELFTAR